MNKNDAHILIAELEKNPERFFEEGRAYDLLQEYFKGEPVDSLGVLLTNANPSIRKSAVWIVSELGGGAISIAEQVLTLLNDDERYVKYYALESLMVFSSSGLNKVFHHVVLALEDEDDVISKLGMYLISKSSNSQLEEAIQYFSNAGENSHLQGLRSLLVHSSGVEQKDIGSALYSEDKFLAMYRAISIKREMEIHSRKIQFDSSLIEESIVKNFLNDYVYSQSS